MTKAKPIGFTEAAKREASLKLRLWRGQINQAYFDERMALLAARPRVEDCGSGWTGDRCHKPLGHSGRHSNE